MVSSDPGHLGSLPLHGVCDASSSYICRLGSHVEWPLHSPALPRVSIGPNKNGKKKIQTKHGKKRENPLILCLYVEEIIFLVHSGRRK